MRRKSVFKELIQSLIGNTMADANATDNFIRICFLIERYFYFLLSNFFCCRSLNAWASAPVK